MNKKKIHNDFEKKLEQFWQKGFNEQEKADFEQFLAENPFEQEAFEGLQNIDKTAFETDVAEIRRKLPQYRKKPLSWQAIAASVAVLLGILGIIVWLSQEMSMETPIALQKNETQAYQTEKAFTPQNTEKQSSYDEKQNSVQRTETNKNKSYDIQENQSARRENYIEGAKAEPLPEIKETKPETQPKTDAETLQDAEKNIPQKQENKEAEELQSTLIARDDKKDKQETSDKKQAVRPQKLRAYKENRALNIQQDEGLNSSEIWQAKVLEATTGKPLQGVIVFLDKSPNIQIKTDAEGNFSLQVPLNEKNILHLQKEGYKSLQVEIQNLSLKTFYLKPEK
jgi:hypothetical protein